ncbi:uncharacterized protein FOMMEDRAFT_94586 [Fomitiporia mediterranea MF3/22]|uniref:uncharacterized protein n=1 Tax=Fomitiporia mediterranea (strain MF3/22) TaxID=694068 RepID=UPI000440913D|nr:uncharacterized protein FOMMEDRAFT_94586 [Fomitiporia mediterranea MF3/22]EJC99096.1 hypothetical protein FOMMEDRAFT_94586 [Fomitiporia mediterranea MF3/22]
MKTNNGTGNLLCTAQVCDSQRKVFSSMTAPELSIPYSEATHQALIALRCAKSNRPFNSVKDKYYGLEVNMLCLGTVVPVPSTILKDIKHIYEGLSVNVCNYFKVCSTF